jgi:hypothetical protein
MGYGIVIDMFNGWQGVVVGLLVLVISWTIVSKRIAKDYVPRFDEKDRSFETLLTIYLDVTKFIVGLAAGGIVLVVGSFALQHDCRSNRDFAAPLLLLAMSIIYGLLFMPLLVLNYESFKLGKGHARRQYIRNRVLAYSGLSCFCIGYTWLIFVATH